jgi:hypothetical protein
MTDKKQPRILIERMKVYRRVPKAFRNKDCNADLYKSFARFPVKNPHWQFEVIEYQGHEFLLESVQEVAFDSQGRSIHYFRETKDELEETTTVYLAAADGKTVEVHACSNGRVTIGTSGFAGSPGDDPNCYWINDGRMNGFIERQWTEAQKRYMDIEDRYYFGDGESNMTEEEIEEANRLLEEGHRHQVIEQDEYGKSLREISWDCDEILDYIENEYVYAVIKM